MQALLDLLGRELHDAQLEFVTPIGARWTLGRGLPCARVNLAQAATLRRILLHPRYELPATYTRGEWAPADGDLLKVLEVATRIQLQWDTTGRGLWGRGLAWLGELNSALRARRNVHAHYDRDADFYGSFLDADWHYSCGYFERAEQTLEAAQQAKCELIARKLNLRPGARVLDIGCGFGSLAMYLAERHQARVTGVTLSEAQLALGRERLASRDLHGRVELRLQDYRHTQGQFDAVVSVGMFEHVGRPQYAEFFRMVRQRLVPGGTSLIHTIGRSGPPGVTNPWIRRHIFPGGYIPAASEVLGTIEHASLVLTDLEIWRQHYAHTLAAWHQRFESTRDRWRDRYGEEFCRMWTFYLLASQASFQSGDLVVFQLQLARRPATVPLTRDYLYRSRAAANFWDRRQQRSRKLRAVRTRAAAPPKDRPEQDSEN